MSSSPWFSPRTWGVLWRWLHSLDGRATLARILHPPTLPAWTLDPITLGGPLPTALAALRVAYRAWLAAEIAPTVDAAWLDGRTPPTWVRALRDAAWAQDARGQERPALRRGLLAFENARVDASFATLVGVQEGLVLESLVGLGSRDQQAAWCDRLQRYEALASFALTEPLVGSAVALGLTCTAAADGDHWILSGQKRWIGNATLADVLVVYAQVGDAVHGFLVRAPAPGLTIERIEDKMALRGIENAVLTFDGVRVADADRLPGCQRFKDVTRVLTSTRAGVAWMAAGLATGAYDAALAYVLQREQFGRPVAGFQATQIGLARMAGRVAAITALCRQLADQEDAGTLTQAFAALGKLTATHEARAVVAEARALCGGNGITLSSGVARAFADAEALYSYEGSAEMNALIVGRALTGHSAFV